LSIVRSRHRDSAIAALWSRSSTSHTPHLHRRRDPFASAGALSLTPVGGLRAATCATIFGLIATTGLRISEAVGLTRADVDLPLGRLQIREGKFHKSRWVSLHPSAVQALRHYARQRDRDPLTGVSDAFFVFDYGRAASVRSLHHAFKVLRNVLRWRARGGHRHPSAPTYSRSTTYLHFQAA
jgi:integrase